MSRTFNDKRVRTLISQDIVANNLTVDELTVNSSSIVLPGVVFVNASQTLTNKTLNNASNTFLWSSTSFTSNTWTTPIPDKSYTIYAYKLGQIVTLYFPEKTGTTNSTNGFSKLAILPAEYRPAQKQEVVYSALSTIYQAALCIIETNGDVDLFSEVDGSIWPSGGVAFAIRAFSVTYSTVL